MSELFPLPEDPLVPELRAFAARWDLARRARELDREPAFPQREFRAMGEAGLLGLTIGTPLGGRGLPPHRAAVALFHLGYLGGTTFAKLSLQPEFSSILAEHGSSEMIDHWFSPLLRGERLIGNQLTEPGAGSDATALALTAASEGDEYVLTGQKSEVAFALDAEAAIVYGRQPETAGAEGITAFLVPQDLPGVRRIPGEGDLGERWQRRGEVEYSGARVPRAARLGEEGQGFRYARAELARERGLLAALYLGVARASWEETVKYVGQRAAFDGPLSGQEAVAFPIVNDAVGLEAAWLFTLQALRRLEDDPNAGAGTALAKATAVDVALRTIDHAIQFHGGRGYSQRLPHEQRWRDVRSGAIAHGPTEVLYWIAARQLWRRPRP
jgi:alkylation response protein AidB-like acyl-CoA dehydrogenase